MKPTFSLARLGAAAALALSLAACDRTPVGTDAASLVGTWTTGAQRQSYATPTGDRMMDRVETWSFYVTGRFERRAYLYDDVGQNAWFDYLEVGTYAVPRRGVLELTPEQVFYRAPDQFVTQPVLQPAPGYTLPVGFSVRGSQLTAIPGCPVGYDCAEPQTLVLYRAPEID